MSTIVSDYNLALVQVTLSDFRVDGWAADDAVQVTPMSDTLQSDVSADGAHVAMSRINDPRVEVTMTVRRGTPAYKLLSDAQDAQEAESAVGAVSPLPFGIYDPISGDKIVERNARFMRRPDMTFAKTAPAAEFKLLLPNPDREYGTLISTSA